MNFNVDRLAKAIQENCPEAVFAFLHGSAKDGTVEEGSDIDIALYLDGKPKFGVYSRVMDVVESIITGPECDVGILNNAEPIYRFEALKGRMLFCRDKEQYLRFFSLTCREYEDQVADYERQRRYRLQTGRVKT